MTTSGTPSHTQQSKPRVAHTQSSDAVFPSFSFASEEITLPEFAQKYHNDLPQQVIVTHGVYWKENMEINISNSERLNIHFIRHRESVKIKELGSSTEYSVPVTSTLEFGPVYNPYNENVQDALRGFIYPTVADIMKITENAPLPRLISATSNSSKVTPGDPVCKGELLLIKEVKWSRSVGYRELLVTSLTSKMDKVLHESCRGNFTTKPVAIKLSLFSIIQHVPNALPLSVMIFPGENFDHGDMHYPSHLFEKVIQLKQTFTDVLLVASSVPDDSMCDSREPFEIPQEVDLELRVVKLEDKDREQLKERSQQIMQKIQGDYIKQYSSAHQDQAEYVLQEMFFKAVGIKKEQKKSPVARPRKKRVSSEERDENDYPNLSPVQEGLLSRLAKLEEAMWKMKKSRSSSSLKEKKRTEEKEGEEQKEEKEEEEGKKEEEEDEGKEGKEEEVKEKEDGEMAGRELAGTVQRLEENMKKTQGQVEAVESAVAEVKSLVTQQQKEIREELEQLSVKLVSLCEESMERRREEKNLDEKRKDLESPGGSQRVIPLQSEEVLSCSENVQQNKEDVMNLTSTQVVQLLAEIGIDDLQVVSQENVTGDILIELNEEDLEKELGIKRKIHRLKVMKVLKGSVAVSEYLKIPESNSMDIVC